MVSIGQVSAFGSGHDPRVLGWSLILPLPLPAALPACALSLCQINKIIKKKISLRNLQFNKKYSIIALLWGCLGGSAVECLPLAQGMILEPL